MAKVGNEAKLILSLASQRALRLSKLRANSETTEDYEKGFNEGFYAYGNILLDIVAELEQK